MNLNLNLTVAMNMSRLRWALAAVLAALSLAATAQSMRTYQAQEMTTGLVAVIALALLLLVGLGSLGLARLRIARELSALRGGGGGDGELLAARRKRLEAIRASGVRPDGGMLAEVTRADEAGRAYIGRYLVATTVLIGLVGTFAGLMQTLGKMAPLFGDKGAGDIALLVTPLAGLHVTFGASLVAILSTLALALAQGDLALCEEQALALLEDRTTHDLIPRMWPSTADVGERTARAVEDLKTVLAHVLAEAIDASLKGIAQDSRAQTDLSARALENVAATMQRDVARLCATVESGIDQAVQRQSRALSEATTQQATALSVTTAAVGQRLGDAAGGLMGQLRSEVELVVARAAEAGNAALGAALAASEAAITRSGAQAAESARLGTAAADEAGRRTTTLLEESARRTTTAIDELARASASTVADATARTAALLEESLHRSASTTEQLLRDVTAATEKAALATTQAVALTLEPLFAEQATRLSGVGEALGQVAAQVDTAAAQLAELTSSLDGLARGQIAAIDRSGQALLAAFDHAVVGGGAALDTAARTLAAAARDLQSGAETLAPRIGALTTELGALAREVALLLASRGPDGEIGAVVLGELDRLGEGMERLTELIRLAEQTPPTGDDGTRPAAAPPTVDDPEAAEAEPDIDLETEAEPRTETQARADGLFAAAPDGEAPATDHAPDDRETTS